MPSNAPCGEPRPPEHAGNVIIGHQYSRKTAELTTAQVRLDTEMFMHTLYAVIPVRQERGGYPDRIRDPPRSGTGARSCWTLGPGGGSC